MIKKEIRRAMHRKDWETVQKLAQIQKTQAETRKIHNDVKMSQKGFVVATIGLGLTALGLAVKVFMDK